jgi:hypothetical protein
MLYKVIYLLKYLIWIHFLTLRRRRKMFEKRRRVVIQPIDRSTWESL